MSCRALFFVASLLLSCLVGCDEEKAATESSECHLGSADDPGAEVWLLPTRKEAEKLEQAIKSRHQGTINLLFAKYDALTAEHGSKCTVVQEENGFVQVKAESSGLVGWVPKAQASDD